MHHVPSRTCLAVFGALVTVGLAATEARAAGPRPLFQMPVPCGQTWRASTYSTHWTTQGISHPDAIDLAQRDENQNNLSEGEFAFAAAAGTVANVYTNGAGEHRVFLDHGGGWRTDYIHLESLPPLSVGQQIGQGQVVGRVGKSGATSFHLHYNQMEDGTPSRVSFNGSLIDTHAGNLDSYGTYGTDDAEQLTSLNCAGNTFATFNQNGMRYLILYKPASGLTKFVRLEADGVGVTTVWSGDWGRKWTHIVPFYLGASQYFFRYKASTGEVRFDRVNLQADGTTTLSQGTWWAGWTHFMPFALGGKPYFVAYDSLHGYANVERINVEGSGSTTISGGTWTKGWTHFVPYVLGPVQYMLTYKSGSGQVKVNSITGSGDNVNLTEVWEDTWSTGWTHLVPVSHEGTRRLFAYRATTGAVSYGQFNANGQGTTHLGSATWTTQWTSFTPFLLPGGEGGLFLYGAGTGNAQSRQLNAAGSSSSAIWSGDWTTGWR
jgi:hypothetical protein